MKPKQVVIEKYDDLMAVIGGINAAFLLINKPDYREVKTPAGKWVGVSLTEDDHWIVEEVGGDLK